jgi:hypothetical protein
MNTVLDQAGLYGLVRRIFSLELAWIYDICAAVDPESQV